VFIALTIATLLLAAMAAGSAAKKLQRDPQVLDINRTDPTVASNNDVYNLVMHVAADPIEIDELARRLRTIVTANG